MLSLTDALRIRVASRPLGEGWLSAFAFLLAALLLAAPAPAVVTFNWVTIGEPGNPGDPQPQGTFGSVGYVYDISAYETTCAQYAEFLNAVAASDPGGLFNSSMESDANVGGIVRNGSDGSYAYTVKQGFADKPVVFVSFWDAIRFANWLHNGQPTGAQNASTTEDGAYTITPAGIAANDITRNPSATYFVTSEDEWYKAAYYGGNGTWWNFPNGSDAVVMCSGVDVANRANCEGAVGALEDVGHYSLTPSALGTFDQAGNVWEWNEAIIDMGGQPWRGIRGTSWTVDFGKPIFSSSNTQWSDPPELEITETGFRIARPSVECTVDPECDDGNVCTDDTCNAGICQHTNNTASCDDGVACTSGDVCGGGTCAGVDACSGNDICNLSTGVCEAPECLVDTDCDDSNVCTDDVCNAGVCEYADNTASCDDGVACTGGDVCSAGTCSGTSTCSGSQVCNPSSGVCEDPPPLAFSWVTIGEPGNPGDPQPEGTFGAVSYAFEISETETTNAAYAAFLNAVAASDPNGLYDPNMDSDPAGGITRSGSDGSYTYATKPGAADWPVVFVSFWDTLRFANWLNNGQPMGPQGPATTEDGAYTITPQGIANNDIVRNPGAQYFLTSEDEWHKAAYYGGSGTWYSFPNGSNASVTCSAVTGVANRANCNGAVGGPLDVGSYVATPSALATFDQAGNVWEWTEAIIDFQGQAWRGIRGSSWTQAFGQAIYSASNQRWSNLPEDQSPEIGFRVARLSECVVDADCDDGDTCTTDACNAGSCEYSFNTDPCEDGNLCTSSDVCDGAGTCVGGASVDCGDGQFCNGAETCDPGLGCQPGAPVPVDDGVACTDDSCDEANDVVVNAPNDGNCDDGQFCNGAETCDPALDCQSGTPVPVDDGVACTDDSCDETNDVVVNAPNDGNCDDGDPCTAGLCDAFGGCSFVPIEGCEPPQVPAAPLWARLLILGLVGLVAHAGFRRRAG